MRHSIALAGPVLMCLLAGCRAKERAADSGTPTSPVPTPIRAPTPSPAPRLALGLLDESSETASDGGVLRLRLVGEPTTLNAVMQSSLPEAQVLQYVQRNLLDFDAKMQLIPGLAEKMEADAAGREFVLTLRADAVWEDRRPVTARDVAFTLGKIVDPKIPSNVFKPLFEDLEKVEVLGEKRLRVRFRAPYAFRAMGFVFPVLPAHRFAGQDFLKTKENRAPLSSGPYRVVSWKAQQSIALERNPAYFGPPGHFERILFRILPSDTTAYRMLTAGELDEAQLNPALKAKSAADPDFQKCCRLVEYYNLDYSYVALNNRSPFFQDSRVRRALTMLLDRASIVRSLYAGSARIISGPWAPDSPAYDSTLSALPFDPAAAATLLDEAGWRDSNGNGIRDRAGREFRFDLLVSEGSELGRQVDEMLSAELSRVGIAARVRTMEWATFVERVDAGDFSAASLAWSAVDPNPDPYFYWHSSQCAPKGLNDGCYRRAEADLLMEQARRETNSDQRLELFHRLHKIFRDDAPAIFVVNGPQRFAFRRNIRGLTSSPLGLFGIWPGPLGWFGLPETQTPQRPAA